MLRVEGEGFNTIVAVPKRPRFAGIVLQSENGVGRLQRAVRGAPPHRFPREPEDFDSSLGHRGGSVMRAVSLGCLTAVLLGLLGCGDPQKAEVSGTVQLDGQPIEEGSIQFIPVEGTTGPSAGGTITNGQYHIPRDKGVTVGKNRVELRAFKKTGRKVQDPTGPPGTLADERIQAFPPEFNDKSTVVKDVRTGSNTIHFDVQTRGSK